MMGISENESRILVRFVDVNGTVAGSQFELPRSATTYQLQVSGTCFYVGVPGIKGGRCRWVCLGRREGGVGRCD